MYCPTFEKTYLFNIQTSFTVNGFLMECANIRVGFAILSMLEGFDLEKLLSKKYDIECIKVKTNHFKLSIKECVLPTITKYSLSISKRNVAISLNGFLKKNRMQQITHDEYRLNIINNEIHIIYNYFKK